MADLDGPSPGEWVQIAVDHDGALVGDVAVQLRDDGRAAEVGVTLAADQQGYGYAREAMAALLDLLHQHGVERAEAEIDPRNAASIALFERLGFAHERTDLRTVEIRGELCDSAFYSLIRTNAS
jgi:aminoglycoside 6'-N-acetyltransferase